ncbi:MAG TPA: SpoIIE family protein phosphatase, partial [Blastocatellia bacterium]|nr:SpoIIE family protein phosphatase [Blastocatellia bacterium]
MDVNEKTINTLIDAVRQVTSSLNLGQVLDTILDTLKELIDYQAAVVCVVDSKTRAVRDLKSRGYPPHPADRNFLEPGAGIIGWVVENAQGQIVRDVKADTRYVKARAETRSEIAAPIIRTDGEVIGAINLEADQPDRYGPNHLELLTMFASLAASAINNTLLYREVLHSRRVESELELARTVVESLLPRAFPLVEGFDIYGSTIPVRQVGGDYFDFISSISYRLAVLVADVSGKGLPAALVMVSFRAYLLATIINDLSMRVVMSRVNKLVYDSTSGDRFITTFYGLIDPEHKRLLYINAGHNPP